MTPYPYYNPLTMITPHNIDIETTNCISCHTPTLYHDTSQGDTVCTSCGLVHSQCHRSSHPEWRDYSSIDPEASMKNNGSLARAGGSIVDESRWPSTGGLEPTVLGRVWNPNGSAAASHPKLELYRRKIGKTKRQVDRMVDKEFERKVEAGKLAIRIREQKQKQRQKQNGHDDASTITAADNAGGRQRQRYSNNETEEGEDWSEYGTNEHEQIARQRMEEIEKSKLLILSEKWSLDRALLLHGQPHEIPSTSKLINGQNEPPEDIEKERQMLRKQMDVSQKKASYDLYTAYTILQKSLTALDLHHDTTFQKDIMKVVCTFVDRKGSFKVKGVAARLSPELKKKDPTLYEIQYAYNTQRQMAAIVSGVIYLECKKYGYGRTVIDICSSVKFHPPPQFHHESCHTAMMAHSKHEKFVKSKHLSKAIHEFKATLPEYIKSISDSVHHSNQSDSTNTDMDAKTNTDNNKATPSESSSSSSPPSPSSSSSLSSITTVNQILHYTKKLNLPLTASMAITKLVLHCKEGNHAGSKHTSLIASVIYMVCDAAAMMQRLSKTALEKKEKQKEMMTTTKQKKKIKIETDFNANNIVSNHGNKKIKEENGEESLTSIKKKHIRPGCAGRSRKRQRLVDDNDRGMKKEDIAHFPTPDVTPSLNDALLKPLDMTSLPEKTTTTKPQSSPIPSTMQSYYEWTLEKPWNRSLKQIEQSCNTSEKVICEFYRKELYPKRKELLNFLQNSRIDLVTNGDGGEVTADRKANILFSNFASVAPLMLTAKR